MCESKYAVQADMAESKPFRARIAAAVAGIAPEIRNPLGWVYERSWPLAVTPGWCCAYSSGEITDRMIRARVYELLGREDPGATEAVPGSELVLVEPDQSSSTDTGTPS